MILKHGFSSFLSTKYNILTSSTFFHLNMEDPETDSLDKLNMTEILEKYG